MRVRSRPWLAGLAMGVAGLVAGGGLGAWAGSAGSSAPTTMPTTTTVPAATPVDAFPDADPLPAPDPGVFWEGLPEGAWVALADLPDDHLLVVAGDRLEPVAGVAPGRVVALGRGGAALVGSDGLRIVRPDGSERSAPSSGPVHGQGDLVAWTAAGGRGPEVRIVDLGTDDPSPRTLASAPAPGLVVAQVDRLGAVLTDPAGSTSWVVGPEGAWSVPAGETVAALLADRVAVVAADGLGWRDRASGSPADGVEPPVGGRDCLPVEARDRTVLWACVSGFSVSSPWGSSSGAGDRAQLVDDGEGVVWYQENEEGPDLARALHLPTARTASVGSSDLAIRAVAP
ncbi:MAG: hypothetical protein AB1Z55_02330 [Acidimicrobiia bacterium]